MLIIVLFIVLIVNLGEALYLIKKCWDLKKRKATDSEYKKLVDSVTPIMKYTLIISVLILVISYFVD